MLVARNAAVAPIVWGGSTFDDVSVLTAERAQERAAVTPAEPLDPWSVGP